MQKRSAKILLILFFITVLFRGQNSQNANSKDVELKMNFPAVYFIHNSTNYASMPYTVDSCYKYIANNINDISDFVIWRDSRETEQLTNERIKKIKTELNKFTPSGNIKIEDVGNKQKITQRTIDEGLSDEQTQYLLSLNSVFDIARTSGGIITKGSKRNHKLYPKIWCWKCWKSGFHIKYRRDMRKSERSNNKNKKSA